MGEINKISLIIPMVRLVLHGLFLLLQLLPQVNRKSGLNPKTVRSLKGGILVQVIIPTAGSDTRLISHTPASLETLIHGTERPILDYLPKPLSAIPNLSGLRTDLHF